MVCQARPIVFFRSSAIRLSSAKGGPLRQFTLRQLYPDLTPHGGQNTIVEKFGVKQTMFVTYFFQVIHGQA